jgi:quercetin dioxygenase-like cupin family protein
MQNLSPRKSGANVIKSRNVDVEAVTVSAVEGKPLYGGDMFVKPLIKGDEMTFLEIRYAAGVGAPLHTHTHESIAYVVKGKVKSTVGTEEFIMGPWRCLPAPQRSPPRIGGHRRLRCGRDQVAGARDRCLLRGAEVRTLPHELRDQIWLRCST